MTALMGLRQRLNLARLYLCTDLRSGPDELRDFAREAFAGGVDMIQVCDPAASSAQIASATRLLRSLAPPRALVVAGDNREVDMRSGADVLHLADHAPAQVRKDIPRHALVGTCAESAAIVDQAMADPDVDYLLVGPVSNGAAGAGDTPVALDLVAHAVHVAPPFASAVPEATPAGSNGSAPHSKPWFVIGGINPDNLSTVLDAGARRVVVGQAVARAEDPRAVLRVMRDELNHAWAAGRSDAEMMRDAWIPGTEQ